MSDDPITTSLRTPWTTTVDSAAALERRVALQGEQIRLLGSAIHVAGEGIAILTPAVEAIGPRIAFVNDGFLALYRCERTDVIGQTPLAFGIIPEHDAILNALLHAFDSGFHPVAWLGRPNLVNYALIFAYVWASVGFVMVVLSAAIKGIPAEVMEAARVDGAGEWNIFRRIMLPMLSLPLSVVTIWLFINVIKVFDIIYVMTGGGPGTSSRVIAFTMYEETFQNGRPGYGAAVAVIMLVLIAPVMVLNVRRFRSEKVVA